jgi:tungstate transport system ATP-binding protein
MEVIGLVMHRSGLQVLEVSWLGVEKGQTLAVIGPNGSGKSTLLLGLAGLLKPTQGEIRLQGQTIQPKDLPAYRRRIGLVLQDPLLLDTSVNNNLAVGLRFRHLPKAEINRRVNLWASRLGIAHLLSRPARYISGGEAQRASLARAFVLQPELLLLDEPFSALDAPSRTRLLADLQTLLEETRITTVFITHNLDEALMLGDQVAVLLVGRLRQVGTPEAIFATPSDSDVAAFVGVETIIPGQVLSTQDGQVLVEAQGNQFAAIGEAAPGRPVYLCLRPEDITLWLKEETKSSHSSARNHLTGQVSRLSQQGPLVRVVVDCGFPLTALITRTSAHEMGLTEGSPVEAAFKASAVHLIER